MRMSEKYYPYGEEHKLQCNGVSGAEPVILTWVAWAKGNGFHFEPGRYGEPQTNHGSSLSCSITWYDLDMACIYVPNNWCMSLRFNHHCEVPKRIEEVRPLGSEQDEIMSSECNSMTEYYQLFKRGQKVNIVVSIHSPRTLPASPVVTK